MILTGVDRFIINVGNVFCFMGIATCWIFVIHYWYRVDWWSREVGRHIMAVTGGMGLILTYVGWRIVWPNAAPTRQDLIIRALIFGTEFGLAFWRLIIFWRGQRRSQVGKKRQDPNRSRGRHSA